jgi:hypothetical protein
MITEELTTGGGVTVVSGVGVAGVLQAKSSTAIRMNRVGAIIFVFIPSFLRRIQDIIVRFVFQRLILRDLTVAKERAKTFFATEITAPFGRASRSSPRKILKISVSSVARLSTFRDLSAWLCLTLTY